MSARRALDVAVAATLLLATSPLTLAAMAAVWAGDRRSPLYRAPRVGQGDRDFTMLKIRSMRVGADRSGLASTAAGDARVTRVGRLIRRGKLDELAQFWNVLRGDMSVVGPRPNVRAETDAYTPAERALLSVRPGITDLASIVFSDEGDILAGAADPAARYDRLIRPWKSRLGLLYVQHRSVALDLRIIALTALALVSKPRALAGVARILDELVAAPELRRVCARQGPLPAGTPPGMPTGQLAESG